MRTKYFPGIRECRIIFLLDDEKGGGGCSQLQPEAPNECKCTMVQYRLKDSVKSCFHFRVHVSFISTKVTREHLF